jgi:transposase
MILGLVVDGSGTPVCAGMWPGNTADVTVLLPVIDRLRERLASGGCASWPTEDDVG